MEKKLKIGWIGTGVMGKSMCKYILKAGHELSIYSRTESKTTELVELGAVLASTLEIAKNSDIVFLMVGYPEDVEGLAFGDQGLIQNMKEGSYLVDHTTSSPDLAERIYNECKKRNIQSWDAPVSGGDIGAREGRLVVMLGGDVNGFENVQPVIQLYSSKIKVMGAAGKGQHTKMANQVIIAGTMIGVVEGMIYAFKANLDVASVIELLGGGAAGSFSLNNYGPRILKGDFEPGFYVEHFVKDLNIALKECEKMKIKLRGLELAKSFYDTMMADGLGRKGVQGLYIALEKITNQQ